MPPEFSVNLATLGKSSACKNAVRDAENAYTALIRNWDFPYLFLCHHGIPQFAETLDAHHHLVSRFEPARGLAGEAHTGRRARGHDISRLECDHARNKLDQFGD